jgi:L-ribulose-5-phosphate 3-epimerase
VGFTSERYRAERMQRTREIAEFGAAFGIDAVSCHIGFIPPERSQPLYRELIEVTRTLCDATAANGQRFVLETGQESAEVLLRFIEDVERANLKINFDPANIVLYGLDDPIAALRRLREHVISVHCKDGTSPSGPGKLGVERPLGDGEVDFPAFLRTLKEIGYTGPLTIEREEPDAATRANDVRMAIRRLREWKQGV